MINRMLHAAMFLLLPASSALAIDPFYEGANGIRAMVFETNCLACHSSQRTGAQRNGAPAGLNWDVYEIARANGERIITRAAVQMTMPPPSSGIPPLNAEQRSALLAWQAAGYPQAAQVTPQNSTFSFNELTLTVPAVQVGGQLYSATLDLVQQVPGSPTGFGFTLRSAAAAQPGAPNPAVYDVTTGVVTLPVVDLLENGVVTRSVSAQMRYVQGSNPTLFTVTAITNLP